MTRKHFELIANTLKSSGASLSVILQMADALEDTNPRFNRKTFINTACNVHVAKGITCNTLSS